jgi:hypothetical protein
MQHPHPRPSHTNDAFVCKKLVRLACPRAVASEGPVDRRDRVTSSLEGVAQHADGAPRWGARLLQSSRGYYAPPVIERRRFQRLTTKHVIRVEGFSYSQQMPILRNKCSTFWRAVISCNGNQNARNGTFTSLKCPFLHAFCHLLRLRDDFCYRPCGERRELNLLVYCFLGETLSVVESQSHSHSCFF